MKTSHTLWIVSVVLTAGCLHRETYPIKVEVRVPSATVGQGRAVTVVVDDARANSALVNTPSSRVTIEGNLAAPIRSALIDGLKRQGFAPLTTMTSDQRQLRVEIRGFSYEVEQGFKFKTHTGCVLQGACVIGPSYPYERLYRGEKVAPTFSETTKESDMRFINDALSNAVNELLSDEGLIKCLAQ